MKVKEVLAMFKRVFVKRKYKDILVKHRAEMADMFLTTFDKKMYAEALREEGRDEMMEEVKKANALAAEEKKRADDERKRANDAEAEVARLREEIKRLSDSNYNRQKM